jgi:hypothetical protein
MAVALVVLRLGKRAEGGVAPLQSRGAASGGARRRRGRRPRCRRSGPEGKDVSFVLVTGYGRERLPKGALQEVPCVRKPLNCHQMILVTALSSTSQRSNATTKMTPPRRASAPRCAWPCPCPSAVIACALGRSITGPRGSLYRRPVHCPDRRLGRRQGMICPLCQLM